MGFEHDFHVDVLAKWMGPYSVKRDSFNLFSHWSMRMRCHHLTSDNLMNNQIEITVTLMKAQVTRVECQRIKWMKKRNEKRTHHLILFFSSLLRFFGSLYNEPLWPFKLGELKETNGTSRGKERDKAIREKKNVNLVIFTKCIRFRNQKITVTFHFFSLSMMCCVHVTMVKPKQVIAPLSRCYQLILRYAMTMLSINKPYENQVMK